MKILRPLFLAATALTLFAACASKSKSSARLYPGDTSPTIRLYDEVENPGSAVGH